MISTVVPKRGFLAGIEFWTLYKSTSLTTEQYRTLYSTAVQNQALLETLSYCSSSCSISSRSFNRSAVTFLRSCRRRIQENCSKRQFQSDNVTERATKSKAPVFCKRAKIKKTAGCKKRATEEKLQYQRIG